MNWLKKIFHFHDWEDINRFMVDVYDSDYGGRPIYTKYIFIQRCKICNKIRKQIIKI